MPEILALLGVDLFLAMSLLTCLLDENFPAPVPYMYQIIALAGFGHLLVSREFITMFGDCMRFWYCFIYLIVAITNIIAVNGYIGLRQKLWTLAEAFFGAVTFPTIFISVLLVSGYTNHVMFPLAVLPEIPLIYIFDALVACAVFLGIGIVLALRPDVVGEHFRRR